MSSGRIKLAMTRSSSAISGFECIPNRMQTCMALGWLSSRTKSRATV